jgi:hypothetical protein
MIEVWNLEFDAGGNLMLRNSGFDANGNSKYD